MLTAYRAGTAVLIALLLLESPALRGQDFFGCLLRERYLNAERYVFGAVNAECEPTIHTVPFGNWGVGSDIGPSVDGDQFRGWKEVNYGDIHREWNSCTDDFPGPHFLYYNADAYTTQRSDDIREYGRIESWWLNYDPCSWGNWDGHVFNNFDHNTYIEELDPFGTPQTVASVHWPDLTAVLQCPGGSDYCYTETSWVQPVLVTPNVLTAKVKVTFELETTGRQW
jgi:hypothetical protein